MKLQHLPFGLILISNICFFCLYLQSVTAKDCSFIEIIFVTCRLWASDNGSQDRTLQQVINFPKEGIQPNKLYPTGRFQTVLIFPQDTSFKTSCSNLEDETPTVQLTETNSNRDIVLRDETGKLWNGSLASNQNSQKISSKYLSSGKTYSLTITNLVNAKSSVIVSLSVISKDKVNQLCSSLKEMSDQINDEGTKTIKKALLYGKYNLYSYAIPELENLLSEGKTPPKYNVIVYTALALYYDEMGFLGKALEKYNKALEEAKKCSEKMPCDFKITDDQNINAIQVQAFINQRLGYIYLYNPNLNNTNLANTKPIPKDQRLEAIISYLTKSTELLQCATLNDDSNCKILNDKLRLLKQLRLQPSANQ